MKEGYKSIKDILKEVASEENFSEREMLDIWNHQREYTKKQMNEENVFSIFLPFIGTLSLNVKQFQKEIKGKNRKFYKSFINKIEKLKQHENYGKYKNSHKRVAGVNRLARYIISNYKTNIVKSKKLLIHKKCWNIIAKYSNGVFKKTQK